MNNVVIWKTFHPTNGAAYYGEQIFLSSLLSESFFQVISGTVEMTKLSPIQGAVICVRACDNHTYIDQLNEYLSQFKWCVVVITGNEDGSDFHKNIKHPNCKIWLQTPKMSDQADYFLPFGYPTLDYPHIDPNMPTQERSLDWSFAGQITHTRRRDCARILETLPNGKLVKTEGLGSGLAYMDYVTMLRDTKIVPCPGGPTTPDTFRVWEALELGCIPVADLESGQGLYGGNYWTKVLGDVPFPVISHWDLFPETLQSLIDPGYYEAKKKEVFTWWQNKKAQIVTDLISQIEEIA